MNKYEIIAADDTFESQIRDEYDVVFSACKFVLKCPAKINDKLWMPINSREDLDKYKKYFSSDYAFYFTFEYNIEQEQDPDFSKKLKSLVKKDSKNGTNKKSIIDNIVSNLPKIKSITPLYQGKYISLIGEPQENYINFSIFLHLNSDANIFSSIKKKLGTGIKDNVVKDIITSSIRYFIKSKFYKFPRLFEEDFEINPLEKDKYVLTRNGTFMYIPAIPSSRIQEYYQKLGKGERFRNCILGVDGKDKVIYYIDNDDTFSILSYGDTSEVNDRHRLRFLSSEISFMFKNRSGSSLPSIYDWNQYFPNISSRYQDLMTDTNNMGSLNKEVLKHLNVSSKFFENEDNIHTVGDVIFTKRKRFYDLMNELEKEINTKCNTDLTFNNDISIETYLSFLGTVRTYKECANEKLNLAKLKANIIQQRINFDNIKPEDAPIVPNANSEINLFQHQAEGLAKLHVADDQAILSVSTGGGKTNLIIFDILNLLGQGKIKRPMVVMPPNLVGQWASEVEYFTDGKVNAVCITSELWTELGQEKYNEIVDKAPINTIFIVGYQFYCSGNRELVDPVNGVYKYNNIEWIKEKIRPDYIALDECHKIKNIGTNISEATHKLGTGVPYKRIATGTLLMNKPIDLVSQVGFLDPSILGSKAEFESRYLKDKEDDEDTGGRKKKEKEYRDDIDALIKRDIINNTNYIIYTKKDWASALPTIVYEEKAIPMLSTQQKVYTAMLTKIFDEIANDKKLSEAWAKMQASLEEDDFDDMKLPVEILGKFQRLEQFLTAPDVQSIISEYKELTGENLKSPKLDKIDELIDESLRDKYKVIVAVHFKSSADHLMKNSKHRKISAYYDADHKSVLSSFLDIKSDVKVLFAVQQSLAEGLNLQIANRIIIADVEWAPGKLEQLESRIIRPNLKRDTKTGKLINLNEGKTCYINTILCNGSADILKFVYQNWKRIKNDRLMEDKSLKEIPKPKMSTEAFQAVYKDDTYFGQGTYENILKYKDWNKKRIDVNRNKPVKFLPLKVKEDIQGSSKIDWLPWVQGMSLPVDEDKNEMILQNYAYTKEAFNKNYDLKDIEIELIGKVVRTDLGYGVITAVTKRGEENNTVAETVKIKAIDSLIKNYTKHKSLVIVCENLDELRQKQGISAVLKEIGADKKMNNSLDKIFKLVLEGNKLKNLVKDKSLGISNLVFKDKIKGFSEYQINTFGKQFGFSFKKKGKYSEDDVLYWIQNSTGKKYLIKISDEDKRKYKKSKFDGTAYLKDMDIDEIYDSIEDAIKYFDSESHDINEPVIEKKVKEKTVKRETKKSKPEISDDESFSTQIDDDWDSELDISDNDNNSNNEKITENDENDENDEEDDEIVSLKEHNNEDEDEEDEEDDEIATLEEPEENGVKISICTYNDYLAIVSEDDPNNPLVDNTELGNNGFKKMPPIWKCKIDSRSKGETILNKLISNYKILKSYVDEIRKIFEKMTSNKKIEFEYFKKNWAAIYDDNNPEHKNNKIGEVPSGEKPYLQVFPLVTDDEVYLVVDKKRHNNINLSKFGFIVDNDTYIFFGKDKSSIKSKIKLLDNNINIINKDEVINKAKEKFGISL